MKLRLLALRTENSLYQRHLAEYLGVKQQSYARYEAGICEPTLPSLAKLAEFYNTSIDYLLGLTDERKPYKRVETTENAETAEALSERLKRPKK